MGNSSTVANLLSGIEFKDNRLYTLLDLIARDLYRLDEQLNPSTIQSSFGITGQIINPAKPSTINASLSSNNLHLIWASAGFGITYEIRHFVGTGSSSSWDASTILLRTTSLNAELNPVTIPLTIGAHTFLIKSVDSAGNYSIDASFVEVNIPRMLGSTVTTSIIGNFVLLYWTTPTHVFNIDHYNIYKDGVLQGTVTGTFKTIFETVGGTYLYSIEAVDIVGNIGEPSTGVSVNVGNPVDFTFYTEIISTLGGTKTNTYGELIGTRNNLLVIVSTAETFQQHFDTRSWSSPQDQVNAGYPIYIQPALTTGSYVDIFDFGATISNVIATVNWNTQEVYGAIVDSNTLETSIDGITWSAPTTGMNIFASSLRYVRLTLNFSSSNDKSLAYYFNFKCLLQVRKEQDGGVVAAVYSDATGTAVNLNKAFKFLDSITLAPNATVERKAVYDFNFTTINPTTFKVYLFNAAGARVSGDVGWLVRGVL